MERKLTGPPMQSVSGNHQWRTLEHASREPVPELNVGIDAGMRCWVLWIDPTALFLLRKVLPLERPLGGYVLLPPMSARAARVGECFRLLQSLVTQATLGIWRNQVTEVLPWLFLRFEHNLINGHSFQP